MKKYILVTGGQLFNKGAQAMVFTAVTELKNRFPEYDILIISNKDSKREVVELKNYKFKIISFPPLNKPSRYLLSCSISCNSLLKLTLNKETLDFIEYLKSSIALVDISGYALGSDWGTSSSLNYCNQINLAKAFNVPVFILPQSFGPFDYSGLRGILIKSIIKRTLKYPRIIMAREHQGQLLLKNNMNLNNVILTNDLILQSNEIDLSKIYYSLPNSINIDVKPNSIAIIPNYQNLKRIEKQCFFNGYKSIINYLISKKRNIYLIFHSNEDRDICLHLKDMYKENNRVIFIDQDLSCTEYCHLVSSFDYIIASRFHSIVHAYKRSTPAIVIGWAIKYRELTKLFQQDRFQIDIRTQFELSKLLEILELMENTYSEQQSVITENLKEVTKINIFDYLKDLQ